MISAIAGLMAGGVHALIGVDHLAALAPLAVREPHRSWRAGAFWGLGHTCGVAVLGAGVLLLREAVPLDVLTSISERLVGVALIGVGLWGLRAAFSRRLHAHEHLHEGVRHTHIHLHHPARTHGRKNSHFHAHAPLVLGALHGLAGGANLLGVLPALALPSPFASVLYLAFFAVGSVAAMTAYAWLVGAAAFRLGGERLRPYRFFLTGASAAAIVVGCIWLIRQL